MDSRKRCFGFGEEFSGGLRNLSWNKKHFLSLSFSLSFSLSTAVSCSNALLKG